MALGRLLDDVSLSGAQQTRITIRPQRWASAIAVDAAGPAAFEDLVAQHCQRWNGACEPIVAVCQDGTLSAPYRDILAGSAVDHVLGMEYRALGAPWSAKVKLPIERNNLFAQVACVLLDYHEQDKYKPLELVTLDPDDPWRLIYLCCLGTCDLSIDPGWLQDARLISGLRVDDFVNTSPIQTRGSLDDLLTRLKDADKFTPRGLSMVHLPHGNLGSSGMRSPRPVLPDRRSVSYDAGPNVVVVFSPNSVEDAALLWNLRASVGDFRAVPIGVPEAEATPEALTKISWECSRNGMAAYELYVTSASIGSVRLRELAGLSGDGVDAGLRHIAIVDPGEVLRLDDAAGWTHEEIVMWSDGQAKITPRQRSAADEVLSNPALNQHLRFNIDVTVVSSPLPIADNVRIDTTAAGGFYAGSVSSWCTAPHLSQVRNFVWPSRLLMARAYASRKKVTLQESEPGRAVRLAVEGLDGLDWVHNILHAPLLDKLEELAARRGFGWYKRRLRDTVGSDADPLDAVPPSVDQLADASFGEFKKVLGNNDKATRNWLLWAEKAQLIVKGFAIECGNCRAKLWLPVQAFSPPIICHGCARPIETPFGDKHNTEFKYRLSERLRRVYEQDAMGHLLAAHYLSVILGDRLIGVHPGMEVQAAGADSPIGEADVLAFSYLGEFIPVEVKRSISGLTENELHKLDALCATFDAPWSAIAACHYMREDVDGFHAVADRFPDGTHRRIALAYESLLDPIPVWSLDADPFEVAPLTEDEISERERRFVNNLAGYRGLSAASWLEFEMLRDRQSQIGPGSQ